MKFCQIPTRGLLFAAIVLFFSSYSFSQLRPIREFHDPDEVNKVKLQPIGIKFDPQVRMANAPNVEISVEPKDGDFLVYHPTPGFNSGDQRKAQISVLAYMHNKETKDIKLDKVVFEYSKNNVNVIKTVTLPADKKKLVEPNFVRAWQNSREYHEWGDIVYMDAPFPTEIKLKFYFIGFPGPVTLTKKIKAFPSGFSLPFKTTDLKKDEYWSSYSMHGGGGQVFAYDLGVEGYADGKWSGKLTGTTGLENDDSRIWGKPVYAMADGIVLHSLNDCPNNPKPYPPNLSKEQYDSIADWQKDNLWGKKESGGAGNHFYIKHGNYVALYAHMQMGKLTNKFLPKGSVVKKGDLLGYAGNSGSSSGPHLHIHVYTYKNDDEPEGGKFRPLLFDNGFTIGKEFYKTPMSNTAWSHMDKEGIPGEKDKSSYIWPSDKHPYCDYPVNSTQIAKHGVAEASMQEEFDKIWTCGFYPIWVDGFNVGGKNYFNMIFRPAKGKQWVARHKMNGTKYQEEYNKWKKAGYNLLHVDSYLDNNQVNYAAVWVKDNRTVMAYHGQPLSYHETNFKKNSDAGWVPVNVSTVQAGNQVYVTALWEKKNVGGFYARPTMTLKQYNDFFKDYTDKQKYKVVYLNGYTLNGVPMISGIWHKNAPNYNSWWAKHHLTAAGYQTEYTTLTAQKYLVNVVTGYADGGTMRFEGVFSK
jgi:hypothetical protein